MLAPFLGYGQQSPVASRDTKTVLPTPQPASSEQAQPATQRALRWPLEIDARLQSSRHPGIAGHRDATARNATRVYLPRLQLSRHPFVLPSLLKSQPRGCSPPPPPHDRGQPREPRLGAPAIPSRKSETGLRLKVAPVPALPLRVKPCRRDICATMNGKPPPPLCTGHLAPA